MNALANAVVRLCVVTRSRSSWSPTLSDLALLVQESAERGTLPPDEGALLGRALSLHRRPCALVPTRLLA